MLYTAIGRWEAHVGDSVELQPPPSPLPELLYHQCNVFACNFFCVIKERKKVRNKLKTVGWLDYYCPSCRPQWTLTFWVNVTFWDGYQHHPMSNNPTKIELCKIGYIWAEFWDFQLKIFSKWRFACLLLWVIVKFGLIQITAYLHRAEFMIYLHEEFFHHRSRYAPRTIKIGLVVENLEFSKEASASLMMMIIGQLDIKSPLDLCVINHQFFIVPMRKKSSSWLCCIVAHF